MAQFDAVRGDTTLKKTLRPVSMETEQLHLSGLRDIDFGVVAEGNVWNWWTQLVAYVKATIPHPYELEYIMLVLMIFLWKSDHPYYAQYLWSRVPRAQVAYFPLKKVINVLTIFKEAYSSSDNEH